MKIAEAKIAAGYRLGRECRVEENVLLGAEPGRRSAKREPLVVGFRAHLRFGTVLYRGTVIGSGFETGHFAVVREENRIGKDVRIWNHSTIDYGCVIGDGVKIHCNVYVAQYSILEDGVFLAPGVVLANDLFPGSRHSMKLLQGPVIKKGAQVGVNCTILPGVVIGANCVIGAGSVVARSIPDGTVAWGAPAVPRKNRRDLRWPAAFRLSRPEALRFYRSRVAGTAPYEYK